MLRKRNIKKHIKVKSAKQMIGIIQEISCYVPQIRTWHNDGFIKSTSCCIMRKPNVKCLNRIWGRA